MTDKRVVPAANLNHPLHAEPQDTRGVMPDDNPYSAPGVAVEPRARRVPVREMIFLATLAWMTWGGAIWNTQLAPVLYTSSVMSLALLTFVLSCWGCLLVCLHRGSRERRFPFLGIGPLVSVFISLALGLLATQSGHPPHGLILPIAVLLGMASTFAVSRMTVRSGQTAGDR